MPNFNFLRKIAKMGDGTGIAKEIDSIELTV